MTLRIESESAEPATALSQKPPANKSLAEIERRKTELLSFAQSVRVGDRPSFELAAQLRRDMRKVRESFEGLLRPGIKRAHDAHKAALAELDGYIGQIEEVDRQLKREQDTWQTKERRRKEEEHRALMAVMEEARQKALYDQLVQAAEDEALEVFERMAAPPPDIPVVHTPAKAEGALSRTVPTFTLLDIDKIDPRWIMKMIADEITQKGECEWLMRKIRREVERSGKRSEEIIGAGSIEYDEVVSTGVRRSTFK